MKINRVLGGLLFFAVVLAYSASLKFGFINYDDPEYITGNINVNTGLSCENAVWAVSSVGRVNLWHPLTYLSHQLDVELFGLIPKGHHAMNVLYHGLGALFLYLLFAQLTHSKWLPVFIVLIWALHPQRVQSVAWLSERKDVLSGMFFLLSLYVFLKWLVSEKEVIYWLCVGCYALALLSKPSVVGLPFLLLGIYYFFYREKFIFKTMCLRLIPFFTLAVITAIVTVYFQSKGGLSNLASNAWSMEYFLKILLSFSFYIERFFSPTPHQLWFYPDLGLKRLLVSGIISIVSVVLVITYARKSKLVGLGGVWYLAMWLPVSGIVPLSFYFRADRYSYLPQIGLILVALGLVDLLVKYKKWGDLGKVAHVGLAGWIIVLVCIQQSHLILWKSDQTLFKHEMTVNARSLLAPIHYGHSIEGDDPMLALSYYQKAHDIDGESALALTNMGAIYEQQGMLRQAMNSYDLATQAATQDDKCWAMLINLKTKMKSEQGIDKIIAKGLKIYPQSIDIMLAAANYNYDVRQDSSAALLYYRKLYNLKLRNADFVKDYAIAAYTAGHKKEARELFLTLPLVERSHPAIQEVLNE